MDGHGELVVTKVCSDGLCKLGADVTEENEPRVLEAIIVLLYRAGDFVDTERGGSRCQCQRCIGWLVLMDGTDGLGVTADCVVGRRVRHGTRVNLKRTK